MTDKRSHVVREQTVKADMTKPQLVVASPQLFLPVRAQRYWGMIATDRVLPRMLEGHDLSR